MELEGDTEKGAEMTAEELATEEGDEATAEGGDGLTTGQGTGLTAELGDAELGVAADEGLIAADKALEPAEPHEANGSLWWVDRNNDPRGDGVNHNTRTSVLNSEGGTWEGAEVTAEKLATKEGNELTTEGGDGLTAGEGAEVTAPREGEDGVNADMVEGMIVAAQQWGQELLMFDNEVTQELAEGMVVRLEGADCNNSERLHSNRSNGARYCDGPAELAADEGRIAADKALEPAEGEVVEREGADYTNSVITQDSADQLKGHKRQRCRSTCHDPAELTELAAPGNKKRVKNKTKARFIATENVKRASRESDRADAEGQSGSERRRARLGYR